MYNLWFDLLVLTQEAHEKNDVKLLERVYSLADWFFYSTEEDYSNCVAVSFYEHLIDWDKTLEAIPTRVPKDITEKLCLFGNPGQSTILSGMQRWKCL
jgi:hypothetical protein